MCLCACRESGVGMRAADFFSCTRTNQTSETVFRLKQFPLEITSDHATLSTLYFKPTLSLENACTNLTSKMWLIK